MQKALVVAARRAGVSLAAVSMLSACGGGGGDEEGATSPLSFAEGEFVETIITGSVGDGPIIGGRVVIRNAVHARDPEPLSGNCGCYTCRHYSRAYLRHLFVSREILAYRLLTLHNLYYYFHLMARMRQALAADRFADFRQDFYTKRDQGGNLSG